MIVNYQSIQELFRNLNVRWQKGREVYKSEYLQIASKETSTTLTEAYSWFSRTPRMRRMLGEKLVKSLRAYKYELTNEKFESTLSVSRDDIEDDRLGGYGAAAQDFGLSGMQLYDDLVCGEAVNGMFANICFDGQYFVDTDHPLEGSNGVSVTYSNKMTKQLSAASSAAADASIGAAIAMMEGFKDTEGTPLGGQMTNLVLMVPPALRSAAEKLAIAEFLANGDNNIYKGKFTVYVNRWMSSSVVWALVNAGGTFKPFILQERKAPRFVWLDDAGRPSDGPQSERMFMKNEYLFGNEARCVAGYSFPWLIVGSDGTVA
jgi:phage major head subunit gpT-like protein